MFLPAEIDEAIRELIAFIVPGETPDMIEEDPIDDQVLTRADSGGTDYLVNRARPEMTCWRNRYV